MLRNIIAVYKAVFLIGWTLMLISVLLFGLFIFIEADTADKRWTGIGTMLSGIIFFVMLAGNFALILENNDLLRKIAANTAKDHEGETSRSYRSELKQRPSAVRREPTI
jgi:hypothetical protein